MIGDITYLATGEGWLYLADALDLATRSVLGYAMADHMRAGLVVDALEMAAGLPDGREFRAQSSVLSDAADRSGSGPGSIRIWYALLAISS
jgi:transposase InsO family protein